MAGDIEGWAGWITGLGDVSRAGGKTKGANMARRTFSAMLAAMLFTVLTAGTAMAHPVGEDGSPDCFGQRISHGSANFHADEGHGLTPKDRAAMLQETVAFFYPVSPPEFQEFLENFFGADLIVSTGEMTAWVRAVCAGEVPFPEE